MSRKLAHSTLEKVLDLGERLRLGQPAIVHVCDESNERAKLDLGLGAGHSLRCSA